MALAARNRWLLFIGVMILMGSLLAACGDDDDTDTGGDGGDESTWDQPIVFGDGGFASVQFHNRVAQYILENGYGYETESIPAETVALMQGMENNDIQVSMEIWADQIPAWEQAVEDGLMVDLGPNYGESIQGWFVPTYVIEGDEERGIEPMAPDLESVEDLEQYKDLFQDPEQPELGRFFNCIGSWECSRVNDAKLKAYGLDDDYNSFKPGSGPALATSLVSAYETGEPWFGYYWAPTWIFAQLDLTQIEEPEYTDECWEDIFTGTVGCHYPSVRVRVGANAEFAEQAPDATAFLENYESTMDATNDVLLYIRDNEATPEQAALWWLEGNADVWGAWVTEDAAAQVSEALEAGTTF